MLHTTRAQPPLQLWAGALGVVAATGDVAQRREALSPRVERQRQAPPGSAWPRSAQCDMEGHGSSSATGSGGPTEYWAATDI
jgi:hypothetical protein